MKKNTAILLFAIGIASFIGAAILYPSMPAYLPSHWNIRGEVDAFAHKSTIILMFSLPIAIAAGMIFFPKIDPRRNNYQKHPKAYSAIAFSVVGMMVVLNWLMVLSAFGYMPPVTWILRITLGIAFIVMGNFMPQLRSNFFAGFRTPWALDSDLVWRKTQRAGGFIFVLFGVLFIFGMFFGTIGFIIPAVFMAIGVAAVFLYSFLLHRKEKNTQFSNNGDTKC